jgi:hypothetical protein
LEIREEERMDWMDGFERLEMGFARSGERGLEFFSFFSFFRFDRLDQAPHAYPFLTKEGSTRLLFLFSL